MPSVVVASHAHLRGDALIVMEGPYTVTSAFMLTMWSTPSIESRFSQVPTTSLQLYTKSEFLFGLDIKANHVHAMGRPLRLHFCSLEDNNPLRQISGPRRKRFLIQSSIRTCLMRKPFPQLLVGQTSMISSHQQEMMGQDALG